MFDVVLTFMTEFINWLPVLICLILVMNLIYDMLWGGR